MPEELCQVSSKSHYVSLALHSDPSPFGNYALQVSCFIDWDRDYTLEAALREFNFETAEGEMGDIWILRNVNKTQDLDLILNPSSHIEVLRHFPPKSFAFGAKLPALFAKFHSFRQKQENINCCQGERTIQQRTSKLPGVKVQYFDEGVKSYSIFLKKNGVF